MVFTVNDMVRTFRTKEYKEKRRKSMSNWRVQIDHNIDLVFSPFRSHIRYAEELLMLRGQERQLYFVHLYENLRSGLIDIKSSEIINYSSIIDNRSGERKSIKGIDNLISQEKSLDDYDSFYLECNIVDSAYIKSNMIIDPNKKALLRLGNINLPASGSNHGPYPSINALFRNEKDAFSYIIWLKTNIIEHPEYFSFETDKNNKIVAFHFSPKFPGFPEY